VTLLEDTRRSVYNARVCPFAFRQSESSAQIEGSNGRGDQ
jgi:hypothetical protein